MSISSSFTRLDPVVAAILKTPLVHRVLSPGLLLLTYSGRRSGRRITLPVGYRRRGDDVCVLVSEARTKTWWRNFRDARDVELRLAGRVRRGRAVLVPADDAYFRDSAEEVLRRVPGMSRVFAVDFDRRRGLTDAQVARLGEEIACVRIALAPDA